MTNLSIVDVDSIVYDLANSEQAMTVNGAITIKEGVVTLNKAGVLAATIAAPTAGTDDFKRLTIISLSAQAHTVTALAGALVATFSGVIGDTLDLIAYNGRYEVAGSHQVTLA